MEQLEVLREKIATLRSEIAQLHELNEQYRSKQVQDPHAHFAHGLRPERLLEVQQELTKLARLGGRVSSVEQMKEQHRSRPYLIDKASSTSHRSENPVKPKLCTPESVGITRR